MPAHRSRADDAVRITTAPRTRRDELASRQRRYLFSMGIRSACFVGAVVAGVAGIDWLWPILVVGALVLPYVAVVFANAADGRTEQYELADPTRIRGAIEGS